MRIHRLTEEYQLGLLTDDFTRFMADLLEQLDEHLKRGEIHVIGKPTHQEWDNIHPAHMLHVFGLGKSALLTLRRFDDLERGESLEWGHREPAKDEAADTYVRDSLLADGMDVNGEPIVSGLTFGGRNPKDLPRLPQLAYLDRMNLDPGRVRGIADQLVALATQPEAANFVVPFEP